MAWVAQTPEGLGFDLSHAFAGHTELATDLVERVGAPVF
jgi:hypothetical protein